jgi:hypothetical protein
MINYLPHHENDRQRSVNNIWSCILGTKGIGWIFEPITELLTSLMGKNYKYTRNNKDVKIINTVICNTGTQWYWMLNNWFWEDTIIIPQKHERYMNLPIDQLDILLTTGPIQMRWEIHIEPYHYRLVRCIDDLGCEYADGWVPIWT